MTIDFGKIFWPLLKKLGLGILLLIGIFAVYMVYVVWEISEIKQLCKEVVPGTSVSEMQSLISRNGGYWYKAASVKIKDEQDMWVETVCAKSTMCEAKCRIYHNATEVVEATHGVRKRKSEAREMNNVHSGTSITSKKI